MPTTIVIGPDGKEHEIEHPTGASESEIIAYAQANIKPAAEWSDLPGNIVPSAGRMAEDIGTAIMNPLDTLSSLGKTALGGLQNIPGQGAGIRNLFTDYTPYADAMGEMVSDRYGSLDKAKETMITDPVGVLGDVSMLGVPGAALPGKIGQYAGKLANLDPISAVAKGGGKVAGMLGAGSPEQLYKSAVKFPTGTPMRERGRMVQTGLEEGIMPTVGGMDKLGDIVGTSGAELTRLLDEAGASGKSISKDDVLKGAREYQDQFNPLTTGDDAAKTRKQIETTIANQEKIWEDITDLTPTQVLEFKRNMDDKIGHSRAAKQAGGIGYKPGQEQTRMGMRTSASQAIEEISPETAQLNKRMSGLIGLREGGLESAANRIDQSNLLNIQTTSVGGLLGGASVIAGVSIVPAMLTTAAVSLLTNPRMKAWSAIAMNKLKNSAMKKNYIDPVNNSLTRQGAVQLQRMMEQEGLIDPEAEKQGMLAQ